ncbi:MAG: AsnC family protein, partial [Flavobacteriales bacterium]|nr:AsnC family protein [Flavobacteriales bacterium]
MEKDNYKIDSLDRLIIKHLSDNGRKSFKDIATALDVTVMTVHNRYKN